MFTSPKRVYVLISAVVLVVVLGIFYVRAVPVGLIGIKVFEGNYFQGSLFSFGLTGFNEKKVSVKGTLLDYASAKGTTVALVQNDETRGVDLVVVAPSVRYLTENGGGKAALSLSPDGTMLAYSDLIDTSKTINITTQISGWTIKVMNIKTGEMTAMGAGFSPEFFETSGRTMLFFTSPDGITIADVHAKTSQTTPFINHGVIDYAAHISRNGKYVAIANGLTKRYELFKVTHIEAPLGLSPLGRLEPLLTLGVFKGDTFYAVERNQEENSRLWKFKMVQSPVGKAVFTFPNNSPYRVLP
ncbi:hypothetical protein EPO56_01455 [Patescibacteria group bacterium]|nr:MAG: hypothetical protein EPO56_01455 [Patescibacteria group bacterium]